MPRTEIRGEQLRDGEVQRDDLDITTTGQAVTRKIVAGTNISLSSTGVDSGTGDVTVSAPNVIEGVNGTRHIYVGGSEPSSGTGVDGDIWIPDTATTLTGLKGWVNHGSTAGTARPSGYASIEWFGSVEPTNMANGDTWVVTT